MRVGDKWGRCELVSVVHVPHERVFDGGREKWESDAYEVRCECGQVRVVEVADWRGKRSMRDCGCGLAAQDGIPVNVSISMPLSLRMKIAEYAKEHDMKVSYAASLAIRKGFEVLEKAEVCRSLQNEVGD